MRIAFIIAQLDCGGAERVLTKMSNYWVARNIEVCIFTFASPGKPSFFSIDPRIRIVGLNTTGIDNASGRSLKKVLSCMWNLRSEIRTCSPDIVISFIDVTNVVTLIATLGLSVPVIVSERVDPAEWNIGRILGLVRKACYPLAVRIVVQTNRAKNFFGKSLAHKCTVIPNPVESDNCIKASTSENRARRLVSCGRLAHQKGFDLLIEAFSRLATDFPEWTVHIYGDGPLRAQLQNLIEIKGLKCRVTLEGRTDQIAQKMQDADLFVFPSRFEGFPNALCEAMAVGMPVVSFDCPSGPSEIIRNRIDGILVSPIDADSLCEAMREMFSNGQLRENISRRAPEVVVRFGIEAVMCQWMQVIKEVVHDQ